MTLLSFSSLGGSTHSTIPSNDSHVRYVGRFDLQNADGPRCAWPASMVEFSFKGSTAKVKLRESGLDQYQVVIDGSPTSILKPEKGDGTYELATNLPSKVHRVQIVKRTESYVGMGQFLGFDLDGPMMNLPKSHRLIEVIGDSISCGYGNEGKVKEEHFKPDTENAYLTYGALTARELNADFHDIAWSGRKMWPDNTIPEIYDLALPEDKTSTWNLKDSIPDVIVINLATNDFGNKNPDQKGWTEAYSAFIQRLRGRAPKARIYCTVGPMMTDNWPPNNKALTTVKSYLVEVLRLRASVGDDNIRVIEFETQDEARDGIGSDWHPNLKTHRKMADVLEAAIRSDLKW